MPELAYPQRKDLPKRVETDPRGLGQALTAALVFTAGELSFL